MHRRTFLLGVGGAAVAGTAVVGPGRIWRRLTREPSPDRSFPAGGWEVAEATLRSEHVPGVDVRWSTSGPPDGAVDYVVVCLHGRGNDHRYAFDDVPLHDVAAEADLRVALVSVDGGGDRYWHERDDGTDYGQMVVEDLVPLATERWSTEQVALLGWSMGGFGALLLAERHPERFVRVAASPALWRTAGETPDGAFDDAEDFAAHDVLGDAELLDPARVRIDCGEGDPFVGATRELAGRLGPDAVASFGPGNHDAAYWRSVAPAQLRFLTG